MGCLVIFSPSIDHLLNCLLLELGFRSQSIPVEDQAFTIIAQIQQTLFLSQRYTEPLIKIIKFSNQPSELNVTSQVKQRNIILLHLFGQVSTCTGCYQLPIFRYTFVHQ